MKPHLKCATWRLVSTLSSPRVQNLQVSLLPLFNKKRLTVTTCCAVGACQEGGKADSRGHARRDGRRDRACRDCGLFSVATVKIAASEGRAKVELVTDWFPEAIPFGSF